MSRIEHIRRKVETDQYSVVHTESYKDDIRYLLSKLDIADDALDTIEDMCNDPMDVEIAEKALQQIRE